MIDLSIHNENAQVYNKLNEFTYRRFKRNFETNVNEIL